MIGPACYSFTDVPNLAGRSVLVVDDDQAQREVVQEILEMEGIRVLNAPTLEEALPHLHERIDVVLLDLHGVDTERLVPLIRSRPDAPAVLVVSGDTKLAQAAEQLGADAWLGKPYELDELLDRVAQMIDRREASQPGAQP